MLFIFSDVMSQKVVVNVHYEDKTNSPASDTIYYHPGRKLTWADFKGKPDLNHFGGAITASGFAYSADIAYDGDNIIMNFFVYTFFLKNDSWRKQEITGQYHLEHEQRHFDITYIGALKFVNELRRAQFTMKNFKKLAGQIFNKAYEENTQLQHQYDRETKHSINKEAQVSWNVKIAEMLQSIVVAKSNS